MWGLDFVCEGGAGEGVIGFTVGVTLGFAGLGVTCCTRRKNNNIQYFLKICNKSNYFVKKFVYLLELLQEEVSLQLL